MEPNKRFCADKCVPKCNFFIRYQAEKEDLLDSGFLADVQRRFQGEMWDGVIFEILS